MDGDVFLRDNFSTRSVIEISLPAYPFPAQAGGGYAG